MHYPVIKQNDEGDSDADPIDGIGKHNAYVTPFQEQANDGCFRCHDHDRVGVVPEQVRYCADDCRGRDTPSKPEDLKRKHGEDAAEDELDIEEYLVTEVISGKAC